MPRHSRPRLAGLALALIATCWLPGHGIAQSAGPLKVRNWAYQLQGADPAEIAASPFDLVVIDYSRDGTEKGAHSLNDVQLMRRKADGGRRVVLSYMSIGEAEDYRYYWDAKWKMKPPAWLEKETRTGPATTRSVTGTRVAGADFWHPGLTLTKSSPRVSTASISI